jgi:hypothetical protein
MTRSIASTKFLATVSFSGALIAFAAGSAFAQHGGGHMGGGGGFGGGGGHWGGGGGSHSAPAPSHSAPAHSAPATNSRPPVSTKPASNSASGSSSGNAVTHAPYFGTSSSRSSGSPTIFVMHGEAARPRTSVIGFPPADSHVSAVDPSVRTGSGALSFSGQGHTIWQDSAAPTHGNALASAHRSESERALFGDSVVRRPTPPHRVFGPVFGQPFYYVPAFGFYPLGFYGSGFCDPFGGFDPGFGCGGQGFGFGYGLGYGYPGYFGSSDDGSFSVGSTTGPTDYENDTPSDNSGGTYRPAPEQGGDLSPQSAAPAPPPATLIYLKDGTSYEVMSYWLDAGKLHYITNYGGESTVELGQLDLQRTVDENSRIGVDFTLRPAAPPAASPQETSPQPAPQQ